MAFLDIDAAPVGGGTIAGLIREALANLEQDQATTRHCLMGIERLLTPDSAPSGGLAPWQVKRVRKHIDAHLAENMSLQSVACEVRLGPSHFSRNFRKSFGQPFTHFVASQRIQRAQRMMVASDVKLCEVAVSCGFADQAHFSRAFHRHAGETPARWRRKALGDPALQFRTNPGRADAAIHQGG